MPRFILLNWVLGAVTGLTCAALLLVLDPVGLRPLIFQSDVAAMAIFLLCGGFVVTFGGVVCAAAVMLADGDEPESATRAGSAARRADASSLPALRPPQ